MSLQETKRTPRYIGLFAVLFLALSTLVFVVTILLVQIDKNKEEFQELLNEDILNEAVAQFDNILIMRVWNASHGGVYVKQHEGITPNIYLRDNVLLTDKNETLIKINPAWMTRQISEIANKNKKYYYKITSLNPLNPSNKADEFEKEALNYFEKNKEDPYYSVFKKTKGIVNQFDFMGNLRVTEACMACHAEQGYKVGDVRGGIRVTLFLDEYHEEMTLLEARNSRSKLIVILFGLILATLAIVYIRKIFTHQKEILELNEALEEKVQVRTLELVEMNKTLEARVANEVQKSRKKDESMLTQSRYIAMGEMIEMLAHQWRQPIAVIEMSSSNLLVDFELGVEDKEEMRIELENISMQTQSLSKIISNFSDIFNTQTGESFVVVRKLVEEVLGVMQSEFEEKGIAVVSNYASEAELKVISRDLFQVYWNLINNAKDILSQREVIHPKITISIEESETEVISSISDNAGGIPQENMSKIYEPYFSTKEDLNGRGLGLYICKTIVDKHLKGSIQAYNSDVGAVFVVKIPK